MESLRKGLSSCFPASIIYTIDIRMCLEATMHYIFPSLINQSI